VIADDRTVEPENTNWAAWKDLQRRIAGPSATIAYFRKKLWQNRTEDNDDGWQQLKADSKGDAKDARELDGHPLLVARDVPKIVIDPYEVFTAPNYTETDAGADIVVTGTSIAVTAMPTNLDSYVYKDFGAGFFSGDYTHLVETRRTGGNGTPASGGFYATATDVNDFAGCADVAVGYWYSSDRRIFIAQVESGAFQDFDSTAAGLLDDGWYYITWARALEVVTVTIRDTGHGEVATDTLVMDDTGAVARRYAYGVISRSAALSHWTTYDVRNLDLQLATVAALRRRIEGY